MQLLKLKIMNDNDIMFLQINTSQKNKIIRCHLISHLILLCLQAHKALIHCLHLYLTLAAALADAQLFYRSCNLFLSVFLLCCFRPAFFSFFLLDAMSKRLYKFLRFAILCHVQSISISQPL